MLTLALANRSASPRGEAPIPAKLVRRIQALEFVEMRELLPDNMPFAERLEALPVRLGQPAKRAEQREIYGEIGSR